MNRLLNRIAKDVNNSNDEIINFYEDCWSLARALTYNDLWIDLRDLDSDLEDLVGFNREENLARGPKAIKIAYDTAKRIINGNDMKKINKAASEIIQFVNANKDKLNI